MSANSVTIRDFSNCATNLIGGGEYTQNSAVHNKTTILWWMVAVLKNLSGHRDLLSPRNPCGKLRASCSQSKRAMPRFSRHSRLCYRLYFK